MPLVRESIMELSSQIFPLISCEPFTIAIYIGMYVLEHLAVQPYILSCLGVLLLLPQRLSTGQAVIIEGSIMCCVQHFILT